jgi:hypothetical protein
VCASPYFSDYSCSCSTYGHAGYLCAGNQIGADEICEDACLNLDGGPFLSYPAVGPIGCSETESEYNCTLWVPSNEVDYNTGTDTYLLDFVFVSGLIADPEPLWGCDDATVLLGESGFEVADANSGELLYELGLRNGDVILSLNNIDLDSYMAVGQAFFQLWLIEAETDYVLEIERNSSPVELNYYVYVTL